MVQQSFNEIITLSYPPGTSARLSLMCQLKFKQKPSVGPNSHLILFKSRHYVCKTFLSYSCLSFAKRSTFVLYCFLPSSISVPNPLGCPSLMLTDPLVFTNCVFLLLHQPRINSLLEYLEYLFLYFCLFCRLYFCGFRAPVFTCSAYIVFMFSLFAHSTV